jgi:hypothetical protein
MGFLAPGGHLLSSYRTGREQCSRIELEPGYSEDIIYTLPLLYGRNTWKSMSLRSETQGQDIGNVEAKQPLSESSLRIRHWRSMLRIDRMELTAVAACRMSKLLYAPHGELWRGDVEHVADMPTPR